MTTCHLDIESYSECDLGECGAYRYAEDPSTEILCIGFAFDDQDVRQWRPGEPLPPDLVAHVESGGEIRAHNAAFERTVLNGVAGRKIGFPRIRIEQTVCTAVKCAEMGIPRSLEQAAKALGTRPKSEGGRIQLLQICKPKRPTKADPSTRYTPESAPDKFAGMYEYNLDDVRAEREIDNALPDIDEQERRLYNLDQRVNDLGWAVDLEAVQNILFVVEQYREQLAAECEDLTRDWITGEGLKPTQREKIADWIRANGFPALADMQAETVRQIVKRGDVPQIVKRLLIIYSTYNSKATAKLPTMLRAVCADGRLHGMFQFYGAATGRWSSQIVQLQNCMRPVIKDPNTAIEAFAARDLELIRMLWPDIDPMKVAGSCVRGCLVGSSRTDLVAPDFSGIEDRVNAWFFDEEWVLNAYRAYDEGKGRHLYSLTVCRAFGLDLAAFSDEDPRRQWGKVQRLALGYEGGVSAFATMVDTYGIDLEELAAAVNPLLSEDALDHAAWMRKNHPSDQPEHIERACNGLKYLWRRDHPHIVQGWKNLKEAAEKAVEFEGETFWLPNRKIAFRVETYKGRKWLAMRLPSGRKIRYFDPKWTPPKESERWINNELVPYTIPGFMDYRGVDTYTRQWMRLQTYGGKLDENADQGFSRDLLCNAMLSLDAAGYAITGSEHDKVILEIPERPRRNEACPNNGQVCAPGAYDSSEHCLACDDNRGGYSNPNGGTDFDLSAIKSHMIKQPAYADGLPLATDGKRSKRYGK